MNLQEINTLVAEKVMEWKLQSLEHADFWMDEQGGWVLKQLWRPSTDIRDAWMVAEKMNKDLDFDLHKRHDSKEYMSVFWNPSSSDYKYFKAYGNTAPLAICLAALKAVGQEVE